MTSQISEFKNMTHNLAFFLTHQPISTQIAIMLDDIIDDVEPWCLLAGFLKEQGAQKVYAMAPHGILSGNALELINSSASLDQVVITNTGG